MTEVPAGSLPTHRVTVVGVLHTAAIAVVGAAVLALGVILMPGPGPGLVVVAGGLAILATRFLWARRLLDRVRERVRRDLADIAASRVKTLLMAGAATGLVSIGVVRLAGVPIPFVHAVSAALLILSGVSLLATVAYARRHRHDSR